MSTYRIAVLLEHTRLTGETLSLLELTKRLTRRGHTIDVFTTDPPPSWTRVDVPMHHVARFDERDIPESDFVLGSAWTMAASTIGVRRGLPLHYAARPVRLPVDPAERHAYELPTFTFSPSRRHQRLLQTQFHSRCWYIPVAVDSTRHHPTPIDLRRSPDAPPPWRIVIAGEDVSGGGVHIALDAVDRLRAAGHDIELIRVSARPMGDAESRRTCIDRWLGPVSPAGMHTVMSRAHVYLGTCADEEAVISRSALDAIAAGAAPVLTDLSCHHELAPGDAHAVFVPAGDADAMAAGMERVLTDPSLRTRLFEAGRNVVARLDWEVCLDRFESMLAEILDAHRLPYMLGRTRRVVGASRSLSTCIREPQYELAGQMAGRRRVLVLGCGPGAELAPVVKAGPRHVVAIDRSEIAITHAKQTRRHPNVRYEVGDASHTSYEDGSFDLVLALDLLDEVEDAHSLLRESARLLSTRGALLISTPTRSIDRRIDPADDPALLTPQDSTTVALRRLLHAYFDKVVFFGEQLVDDTLSLKPEPFDESECVAIVAMAVQKQRRPEFDEAEESRRSRRAA